MSKTVHALVEKEAVKALDRRREVLAKRLENVRTPELAGIEEAAKRPGEKRLERELRDIEDTLDKLKKLRINPREHEHPWLQPQSLDFGL